MPPVRGNSTAAGARREREMAVEHGLKRGRLAPAPLAAAPERVITLETRACGVSMAEPGDRAEVRAIDRSERQGHVGLLLVLASALVGATVGLSLVGPEQAQTLIVGLLALLAMAGVFFLFALGIGAVAFVGQGTRNDLTKILADTASEGVVVVEDDGRVIYANETYLTLAGAESRADLRTIERLFTGAPEVSEA